MSKIMFFIGIESWDFNEESDVVCGTWATWTLVEFIYWKSPIIWYIPGGGVANQRWRDSQIRYIATPSPCQTSTSADI